MQDSIAAATPVKQISELLSGMPETLGGVEKKEETQAEENVDESQENVQSLEQATENEPVETPDEESVGLEAEAEDQVDTLNNLAEQLDVPVEDLYALNLKMPDESRITLGDLKDFYSTNKDIEDVRQNMIEREELIDEQLTSLNSVPQITNDAMQARAQVMSIQSQYSNIDWDTLRSSDPGRYAALQTDFKTQFDLAKQNESRISDEVSFHEAEAKRYQQERLFEAMPELADEVVRVQAGQSVQTLASKYGFTPEDVSNIVDHRLMRLLIDASKLNVATNTVKEKLQKTEPTNITKSKSATQPTNTRKDSLKRLTEKAKASGDRRDQTAAVSLLLNT